MGSSKERPSEVELPKHIGYQDEVKTLERLGELRYCKRFIASGRIPDTPRVRRNGRDRLSVWGG